MPLRPVGAVFKSETKQLDSAESVCIKNTTHDKFKNSIRYLFRKNENISKFIEERFYPSGYRYHEPLHLSYKIINSIARNGRRWSLSNASETFNTSLCASNLYGFENKEIKSITKILCCNNEMKGRFFSKLIIENPVRVVTSKPYDCCYENVYSKHAWFMVSNYKNNSSLHMSDVVKTQYVIASKNGGFYGQLPSMICRSNVVSRMGSDFINKYHKIVPYLSCEDKRDIIREFLDIPGNGHSTRRILDDFNLEAIDIDVSPHSIYLHVKKK